MIGWQGVVLHHTAGKDGEEVDLRPIDTDHRSRGWRAIGYHLVIERVGEDYEVLFGRPWHWPGAHAPGKNQTHLGVALVGDFTQHWPPEPQLELAAATLAGLCHSFGWDPHVAILLHRDLRATACPGDSFPVAELFRRVEDLL